MASSSPTILPSPVPTARWAPSLGVLLAGLGMILFCAGVGDMLPSAVPAGMESGRPRADAAEHWPVAPEAGHRVWRLGWSGAWTAATDPGRPPKPSPDAQPEVRAIGWCPPCPPARPSPDATTIAGADRLSAALFGPPARSLGAEEALAAAIERRGDAGGYLDPKVTARWTARWYRAVTDPGGDARQFLVMTSSVRWAAGWYRGIADWDVTSGYGAIEAGRTTSHPEAENVKKEEVLVLRVAMGHDLIPDHVPKDRGGP